MADLTAGHIPIPYVMGYDTRPFAMPEKTKFLNAAADNDYYLFLEHDAHNEIVTVQHTEKGIRLKESSKRRNLKIVLLIFLLYNKMGYFRPIITTINKIINE
jgi:hypothetical protein